MVKKAIQRLGWRFSEALKKPDHSFRINQNDIQALQEIDAYVTQTQEQQYKDHELFAKLFTYLYMKILENDKADIYNNHARRKIYNLLQKPMYQVVEEFRDSLNESELYELLNDAGIDLKHPASQSEQERESNISKLANALETKENMQKLTKEVWDFDTVKECIEAEVNQAIEKFESRR
jgi:hypothetical protein